MISWDPSGTYIVTSSDDRTIRVWDAKTGEQILVFTGHPESTICISWSPDGNQIASSDFGSSEVILWDPLTGEERISFTAIPGLITMNTWSPDGKRLLSTGAQGKALIWDSATGEVLLELFPQDFELDILPGDWTKDGKRVLVQTSDGTIHIFEASSGKELSLFPTHQGAWNSLTLSPSEQRLLKGGDGGARVYDLQTGVELLHYPVLGWTDIAYSPDGSQILVGSNYGSLEIYPTWHSVDELIAYAKSCCVLRQLTPEERAQYGLPALGD
jgi:WD40 repeat protein